MKTYKTIRSFVFSYVVYYYAISKSKLLSCRKYISLKLDGFNTIYVNFYKLMLQCWELF